MRISDWSSDVCSSDLPKGPNHVEFVNFIFAEKDAPEDVKRDMLQNSIQQTGPSGIIEQDDADTWPQIMRNGRGAVSKGMQLKYQALSGHHKPEGRDGEGRVRSEERRVGNGGVDRGKTRR